MVSNPRPNFEENKKQSKQLSMYAQCSREPVKSQFHPILGTPPCFQSHSIISYVRQSVVRSVGRSALAFSVLQAVFALLLLPKCLGQSFLSMPLPTRTRLRQPCIRPCSLKNHLNFKEHHQLKRAQKRPSNIQPGSEDIIFVMNVHPTVSRSTVGNESFMVYIRD